MSRRTWQQEDYLNSKTSLADVDRILSPKYQAKMWDRHGSEFERVMNGGYGDSIHLRADPRNGWQRLAQQQQQMPFGFSSPSAATTIPATVTWLSPAWYNTATYPVGSGTTPVPGSFVQLSGVVYAIPGTVASTPGTPPPGGVWVIQPPPLGGNGWNVNPMPRLSTFAGPAGPFFPTPPVFTYVVDSYWYPGDLQVMSATAAQYYIPSPGRALVTSASATTFSTLQVNIAGTWTTVYTFTATTCQWFELDGMTWRVLNSGTTRNTYTLYRIRQSAQ